MNLKPLIVIGLTCIMPVFTKAQTTTEIQNSPFSSPNEKKELVLHFRFDCSLVDSGYKDNRTTLSALQQLFTDPYLSSRIDSIRIQAFASPEGNPTYNHRLATLRARSVKGFLVWKYPNLNQHHIYTSAQATHWKALQDVIENTPDIPCREEVLQILALNKSNGQIGELLRRLNVGIPYRHISTHILPKMRNASICIVYMRPMKHPQSSKPALSLMEPNSQRSQSQNLRPVRRIPAAEPGYYRAPIGKMPRTPFMAIKTNLLFDAALIPNIEIEVPIGKRWSVNGEYMFPWWLANNNKYCMEVLTGGLEGRYWLGRRSNREVLTGHFLGLYGGGGKYDLQWQENGYQGEFFIAAGISYGYARNIARNLNLEFSLGIGMLRTQYRHYHAIDNYQTLLWQENGKYTWVGPTKVKIALVWLLRN